jgi:hypothetical protein
MFIGLYFYMDLLILLINVWLLFYLTTAATRFCLTCLLFKSFVYVVNIVERWAINGVKLNSAEFNVFFCVRTSQRTK